MSQRYFIETPIGTDASGQAVTLKGGEAHHLAHVMRAAPGQTVELFDGHGAQFTAEIRHIGKSHVELVILECQNIDRELPFDLTLAVALPKGDRQQWLVEKATELGVTRLVPLVTTRGIAKPIPRALDRLRQTVIEASKQCGRNRLMEIAPAAPWSEYAKSAPASASRLIAHKESQSHFPERLEADAMIAAIGPEGGWTDDEIVLALQHAWRVVHLGPRTLRVETAATAIATLAAAARDSANSGRNPPPTL
jgi:16S rRNA (uracil1498-N3)-methyltransferase